MDISVVGAGAMGCLFGARLAEGGHRVTLIDVRADHVDAIRQHGLVVEENGKERVVRLDATVPERAREQAELVVLFTKAFQSEAALSGTRQVIGPQTWVLSLQNGLGHVETIEKFAEPRRIAVGTTTVPSDAAGLGRVRTRGSGNTKIMAVEGGISEPLRRIAAALTQSGLPCEISEQVWVNIWEKLAFNAALNSLTAVTGLTVGQLGGTGEGAAIAHRVAEEVTSVAKRKGIAADHGAAAREIAMAFREHGDHKPSMLQDVQAKRQTEIESINGAIVREAERLGVPVPCTAMLYRLVRLLEQTYRKA
jgi:2-dehydropantoate 2-reductase